jgi:hypothetical protein
MDPFAAVQRAARAHTATSAERRAMLHEPGLLYMSAKQRVGSAVAPMFEGRSPRPLPRRTNPNDFARDDFDALSIECHCVNDS